jgi:adenylate cyclase
MRKKLLHGALIGLAATLVALTLVFSGNLDRLEGATWAWRAKALAKPGLDTDRIKLILLDQASLDWGARENALPWPWPREVYVPIIDFCKRAGVKALAFDVLFTESSGLDLIAQDEALGDAVARSGNFVASVFLGEQAAQTRSWPDHAQPPLRGVEGLAALRSISEPAAAFPVPQVMTNATLLANVKDTAEKDGVFRRATVLRAFDGVPLPSLGLAAYLVAQPAEMRLEEGRFLLGDRRIPVDGHGRAILRYRGPSGTHEGFSAAAVIQSELKLQAGETPSIDPASLKDKYVFFGFSAPGLKDLRPTPISGDYPGVEIHATFLDNLLAQDFLREVPPALVVAGTLMPAILAACLILICRNTIQMIVVFVLFLLLPVARGFAAYHLLGFWWPVVGPGISDALALTGAMVLSYATEGRQKRFIKSAFNQYVGEEVLDEMMRHPSKLRLGGEKKEITMFFSDLEKFSSFSERLDPPRLIEVLNVYLTEMGHVIKQETGGYLDKFVGDAIVAFWNAPVAQPDHAARAVRAAILCQRQLAAKRDEWAAQYNVVLKMRIGIGTGEVVVGNMGSQDKFNYTMLGDAANAASRLEGANKAFGTYTMVSELTWQQALGSVVGREIGAIRVIGRKTPVKVYEPLGLAGELLQGWVGDFEKGLAFCREQRWEVALALFDRIPDDSVSKVYATRCRDLLGGRLKEWDGVWTLTEK